MRRAVVSGVGLISSLGGSAPLHFRRLVDGECAAEPIDPTRFGNYPPILQSRVRDFNVREWVPDRMLRKLLSPSPAMALGSATEALRDAAVPDPARVDCGLYVGSVCLDVNPEALIPALNESINDRNVVDLQRFASRGMKLVDPLFLVKSLPNAGLCAIAIQHQVLGPNANFTNGAISGMQAINAAVEAIRDGEAELALAGGYDTLLQMDCVVEHLLGGRLARLKDDEPARSCRPFRADSDGYALGEGAAFVVVESLEHAVRRGARVYGEILSYGEGSAPGDLLGAGADGSEALATAAQSALSTSGIADPVDLVVGEAIALPVDDRREVDAFRAVAGGARAFTAATPALGFTGAASGVFAVIHALLSLHNGVVPPVLNCDGLQDDQVLPLVRSACELRPRNVLVWNSDRGIKNAATVVAAVAQ